MADEAYVKKLPECDIHRYLLDTRGVLAVFDGKTTQGSWANMCADCFPVHGVGIGLGKGQRLIVGEKPAPKPLTPGQLNALSLDELEDLIGDGDIADYL